MSKGVHISEIQLIEILNKRMDEYFSAIIGNSYPGMRGAYIKTAQRTNIKNIQTQAKKSSLYNGEFWGYGINSISDGYEIHSAIDVEDFKRIQGLNKHHHDQRYLWLLTFKVDGDSLYVNVFGIDTAIFHVNSNLNSKYNLADFQNARIRKRGDITYVDFIFKNLPKPIHFQIDTYAQGGKLHGEQLAEYYVKQITEKAKDVQESINKAKQIVQEHKLIEDDVDKIEKKLRNLFVGTLEKETGKTDYQDILTGRHKNDLKRRIQQHVDKHPSDSIDNYKSLKNSIEFSDLEHLKQSILKDVNWPFFESFFKNETDAKKYFDQLSHLRHTLKHSRKMTELVKLEGLSSIEWFDQIVNSEKYET